MTTPFYPTGCDRLTEAPSLALVQQICRIPVVTPLQPEAIATTYVCTGTRDSNPVPILLLHGFDSSVLEFRRLLPLLADHHETWAVDLLGFGFSDRPARLPITPEAIKAHLYAFWQQCIQRPVIVVGASMGGAAAIDFALSYPEAVGQLVLLDSAGYTVGPAVGQYLIPPLGYLATQFLANLKVRQNISLKAYYDPSFASPDALVCSALHLSCSNWQPALISFTRSGGYRSFQAQLSTLTVPTLILWGAADRILGTADAERFQRAIARSRLVWVEQCGHVPHLEQPTVTAKHILTFCEEAVETPVATVSTSETLALAIQPWETSHSSAQPFNPLP